MEIKFEFKLAELQKMLKLIALLEKETLTTYQRKLVADIKSIVQHDKDKELFKNLGLF